MAKIFRNIPWAIVWDASRQDHVYRNNIDFAFENGIITGISSSNERLPKKPRDEEFDGSGCLLSPGFVNIHTHLFIEPLLKGITDEVGSRNFYMSSLYEYLFLFENDQAGCQAACEASLCELLLSGVTTVCDLSIPYDGWLELLADSGIRAVAAPMFRSGRWYTSNGHEICYEWEKDRGRSAFEAALGIVDQANRHPSGRLSGMVCPAQIDTCSREILEAAAEAARQRNVPLQIHAGQSVNEFHEIVRRHGKTPIGWLEEIGLLGQSTIVGHGIFLDHHSWLHWPDRADLQRLSETDTTIAHCPTVFSRRGITLEDLGKYRDASINIGIGTDTFPHNYIEEMRTASILARVASGDARSATADDLFRSATVNGAQALDRADIGRLQTGSKADFIMIDLGHPSMKPMYDPLRSLIYASADRSIRDVFVDGNQIVENGKVQTIDQRDASARLEEAQQRSIEKVPRYDWASRNVSQLMPRSFELD